MASLSSDRNGIRLQFVIDGERKTVRLGPIKKTMAETVKRHVGAIITARKYGAPLDGPTLAWLNEIPDEFRAKLVHSGLLRGRAQGGSLGDWCREYIAHQPDRSVYSVRNLQRAYLALADYFHADCPIDSITPLDAQDLRARLFEHYGKATANREIKRIKQFFHHASKAGRIPMDPFASIKGGNSENRARLHFVTREVIDPVIAAAGWRIRLVLTLCRYGGLRCPSEILRIQKTDIDFAMGRMIIHGKTGDRTVPLFPEIRGILQEAVDGAHGDHVIDWTRGPDPNWREPLEDLLRSLNMKPWPRLFQNLRASRETELVDQMIPLHVVASWLGNSSVIANKHYLMIQDQHFRKVAHEAAQSMATDPTPLMHSTAHLPMDTAMPSGVIAAGANEKPLDFQGSRKTAKTVIPPRAVRGPVARAGSMANPEILPFPDAADGAVQLLSWWSSLNEAQRAAIRSMACREAG